VLPADYLEIGICWVQAEHMDDMVRDLVPSGKLHAMKVCFQPTWLLRLEPCTHRIDSTTGGRVNNVCGRRSYSASDWSSYVVPAPLCVGTPIHYTEHLPDSYIQCTTIRCLFAGDLVCSFRIIAGIGRERVNAGPATVPVKCQYTQPCLPDRYIYARSERNDIYGSSRVS
jgi:hypothetical protein